MKTVITLFVTLLSLTVLQAQNENIETQSVTLDNLISFIADYFPLQNEDDNKKDAIIKNKQVVFLVETSKRNFSAEDKIILQQAFKFLSKRLTKDDTVSIIVYSGQNGMLLESVAGTDIKKILYAVNNVKSNLSQKVKDGIALAYSYAKDNYEEITQSTIVMVRNPNATLDNDVVSSNTEPELASNTNTNQSTKKNKGNNVVLLTAIAVLPELISIIKD